MKPMIVSVLLCAPLLAQSPGPVQVARAACTLHLQGRIERSAVALVSGSAPVSSQTTEEYDVSIPGQLEEWQPVPGAAEFRFLPETTFASARGSFKTSQTVIRPMQQTSVTLAGSVVGGMGTWYLHAGNIGGQIHPQNLDITMRGKVVASTDPGLPPERENVPVSVLAVPLVATKSQETVMPLLRFSGTSLWALGKNKTPFTAQGEMTYAHRGERDTVRGTVQVVFHVDPTR